MIRMLVALSLLFSNNIMYSVSDSDFILLKIYDPEHFCSSVVLEDLNNNIINLPFNQVQKYYYLEEIPNSFGDFKIVTDKFESDYCSVDVLKTSIDLSQQFISCLIKQNDEFAFALDFYLEQNNSFLYNSNYCCLNLEGDFDDSICTLNVECDGQIFSFFPMEKNDIGTITKRIINSFFIPKQLVGNSNPSYVSVLDKNTLFLNDKSTTLYLNDGDASFLFHFDSFKNDNNFYYSETAFSDGQLLSSSSVANLISKYFTYEENKNNGYLMWPSVVETWIKGNDYYLDQQLYNIEIYDFRDKDDYITGANKTYKTTLKNKCDKMATMYEISQSASKTNKQTEIVFIVISIISFLSLGFLIVYSTIRRRFSSKHS